jgi:hypothetical protein
MALSLSRSSIVSWAESAVAVAFAIVIGGMAFAAIYLATVSGPAGRAAAERRTLQEIADENADFCDRYAGGRGTDRHAACLRDLIELRMKQEKRHDAETSGVL